MAGVGVDSSSTDCPVCSEGFTDPKLLACNHLVCHKCVLAWLTKAGHHGGCPLCRAPILPSPTSSALLPPSGPEELERLVETLPTDLTMVAKVESQKVLSSSHVCMHCDNLVPATSFCLQCNMKLCPTCSKGHKKIPTLKNHVIEDLIQLTPQRLVEINRCTCKNHDDRLAELYCSTHQSLICLLCSSTNHRGCEDVKAIKEAAQAKREELQTQAQRLTDLEEEMKTEIAGVTGAFKAMRNKVKDVFDDLEHDLAQRRQEVCALIQAEEDKVAVGGMDQQRAALASHVTVINNLLTSAPDDALLDMASKMRTRLFDLDQQTTRSSVKVTSDVVFDEMALAQLKSAIASLGTSMTTSTGTSEAVPFTGVDTAMAMGPAADSSVVTASHTSAATPKKTSVATPIQTSVATPKETSAATPQQTSAATPQQMSEATPMQVSAATPKETSAATPQQMSVATPMQASAATPKEMAVATPQQTSVATPKETSVATPQQMSVATPMQASAATPKETAVATPQQTSAATTNETAVATPQQTSVATPIQMSATTPKHMSAVTPKHTSAATLKETSVATPTQTSANSSSLSYKKSLVKTASSTSKPKGADLVKVLKVGDKVKPGPNWQPRCFAEKSVKRGTVIAFPSMKVSGRYSHQCADVRWDNGYVGCHCMGLNNEYALDLV